MRSSEDVCSSAPYPKKKRAGDLTPASCISETDVAIVRLLRFAPQVPSELLSPSLRGTIAVVRGAGLRLVSGAFFLFAHVSEPRPGAGARLS
jgi:hypothetical protein